MRADELTVEIPTLPLEGSQFRWGGNVWEATTLIEAAKDLPVFDLPLIAIDVSVNPWEFETILAISQHMKRVLECNLKYPVILDEFGYICDGWHRVVKALLLGRSTVTAQRFLTMPEPDYVDEVS